MTLDAMLASHDDRALEALTSKGLVRRAQRDLEAGRAAIERRDAESAVVEADGRRVTLDVRGPVAAVCSCPASGVCRHVLLAVMALRAELNEEDASAPVTSAAEEIVGLEEDALRSFAGAEWAAALSLAASCPESTIADDGLNTTVSLSGSPASVVFLRGQGLKGAILKGPQRGSKAIIAAAAILLRQGRGLSLSDDEEGREDAAGHLDPEFIDELRTAVEEAVAPVLAGAAEVAWGRLFDLSVSTRAEAAPRVSAAFRALAGQAQLAAARDVAFEPDRFLRTAATTYALLTALRTAPGNPELTGSLHRDYVTGESLDLWIVGARKWRTESGARGLTVHGYAPQQRRWHHAVVARAGGTDLRFDPEAVYRGPLWGAGTVNALMGSRLTLPKPRIAADGQIALNLQEPAVLARGGLSFGQLTAAAPPFDDWADLKIHLGGRLGTGLRRSALPVPALIAPARIADLSFDDFAQLYRVEALDHAGRVLVLSLSVAEADVARKLHELSGRAAAILVESSFEDAAMQFTPVSVFLDEGKAVRVASLQFDQIDPPARTGSVGRAVRRLLKAVPGMSAVESPRGDPIAEIADAALEAVVDLATISGDADHGALVRRAEAAGLISLAKALENAMSERNSATALRAAYIASELQAIVACGPDSMAP